MAEIWDAYDESFNKIEGTELVRGKEIPEGMYHLVSNIVVQHKDGTFLLMKRDSRKTFGGKWELTVGGSAIKGESPLDCAIRELREETGIISSDLKRIKTVTDYSLRSIYVEFLCITDCSKKSVVLQKGETVDFMWVSKDELFDMKCCDLASCRTVDMIKVMYL